MCLLMFFEYMNIVFVFIHLYWTALIIIIITSNDSSKYSCVHTGNKYFDHPECLI